MSNSNLINVSDLTALVAEDETRKITARAEILDFSGSYIFKAYFQDGGEIKILSTYLSDKPRTFKRADALIKEARNIGFKHVTFDLDEEKSKEE